MPDPSAILRAAEEYRIAWDMYRKAAEREYFGPDMYRAERAVWERRKALDAAILGPAADAHESAKD